MTAPVVTAADVATTRLSTGPSPASIPSLPLFVKAREQATSDPAKVAVVDRTKAQEFTYRQLLADVSTTKKSLLESLSVSDLDERRIAFLVPNGYDYVVTQWAVWAAGGVSVPLCMLDTWRLSLPHF